MSASPAHADAAATGGLFQPATGRILDTRNGTGGYSAPFSVAWHTVDVDGVAGLPTSGISAVAVTFTVVAPSASGRIVADADGVTTPNTSVSYLDYDTTLTSNSGIIPVGTDGKIQVKPSSSTDLVIDVQGYYTSGSTAAGGYVPVDATSVASTIDGSGGVPQAEVATGGVITAQIAGSALVPSSASAVALILTESSPSTSSGSLTVYPAGTTPPQGGLQWGANQKGTWSAVVALPTSGQVSVKINNGGAVDISIAVQGYFTATDTANGAGAFTPLATRAFDSRTPSSPWAAGSTQTVQISGVNGIPDIGNGISAVAINITVLPSASATGHLSVYADDATPGPAALTFYNTNPTTSGLVIVPLGADGGINILNSSPATINAVVDVEGWYQAPALATPTISCPAPYANGSWDTTIPEDFVDCTVTVDNGVYDSSDGLLSMTIDGQVWDTVPLDDTNDGVTVDIVSVPPLGGAHAITATAQSAFATTGITATYSLGFGDWAADTFSPEPQDGSETVLAPTLYVTPDGNEMFGADATFDYTISTNSDGTGIVWVSSSEPGEATVPAETLSNGSTYYWSATITGTSGGSPNARVVTTPTWSFIAASDPTGAAGDYMNYPFQSGESLDDVASAAAAISGRSAVAASLDNLGDAAAVGNDVNFPTLENASPTITAEDLHAEAVVMSASAVTQSQSSSSWTSHIGTSPLSGLAITTNRAWYNKIRIGDAQCPMSVLGVGAFCSTVEAWDIAITINPNVHIPRFDIGATHSIQTKHVLGAPEIRFISYVNQTQEADTGWVYLSSGHVELKTTLANASGFTGANATFWVATDSTNLPNYRPWHSRTATCTKTEVTCTW